MYWTFHLEGGPRRVNHAAVAVEEKIYSFGGYCTGENYQIKQPMDVHVFDTNTLRWKLLPTPKRGDPQYDVVPYLRYGHTAVVYRDKIYIWGGRNDNAADNNLYSFDPETLLWTLHETSGVVPGARDGHSACVVQNHMSHSMYIFGGFEEAIDRFSQELYALDFKTLKWSYLKTMSLTGLLPSYRDFHSATAIGSKMYIFGGRGDRHGPQHSQMEYYCKDILYLDTITLRWHKPLARGRIPIGRRSHSAFFYGGYLYIFGGYNSIREEHFNDLHRFDPKTNKWELVKTHGRVPNKRRRQSCIVVDDKMYLFGGTSPAPDVIASFNDEMIDIKLIDHDDLYVLDFSPSLKMLCIMAIVSTCQNFTQLIDSCLLPEDLMWEMRNAEKMLRFNKRTDRSNKLFE